MQPSDTITEHAALEQLATELAARGYQANLRTPASSPPFLHVRNPRATALSEKIYVQAGSYWFSWDEPIAGCSQPATAATIVARVLRVDSEEVSEDDAAST
jgi:hypothetical protein